MDNTKHTANFLVSNFLIHKICLKPIYGLKTIHIAILRYIADSIDVTYKKTKKFQTKLYQSQIAKFTFLTRRTINKEIQFLIKKRFIKVVDKNIYLIGKVLYAWERRSHPQEVRTTITKLRSEKYVHTSNSSNFTNKHGFASVEKQSTSFKNKQQKQKRAAEPSPLFTELMKKKEPV
jgi:3-polyprenyl-4-hydroxybenzoate decarboxylase